MVKRVLFMVLAIVAAAGTFVLVQNAKKQNTPIKQVQAQPVVEQGDYILVASKTMPAGTFVNNENLKWQLWPKGSAASQAYFNKKQNKIENLTGSVVRRSISAGEPLTTDRLIKPGDRGFVAAILKDGMRAVSVNVNAMTGIAGLVFPGDQVDVLLTHAIRQADDENRPMRQVSETILKNVRVLAMDQSISDDQNKKLSIPKTATLEVTPKQAEILMVAVELGRLSLSLRALSDTEEVNEEGEPIKLSEKATYTLDGEASYLLSADLGPKKVQVVRGSETEEVVVGGAQ